MFPDEMPECEAIFFIFQYTHFLAKLAEDRERGQGSLSEEEGLGNEQPVTGAHW
jgi:hypothetical protein